MSATREWRRVGALSIISAALLGAGCDYEDRRAIRDNVQQLDAMTDGRSGEAAAALIAPESFAYYDNLVKLALDAPQQQVVALPASDQAEVLRMRNRLTRKELEALDGRGWIVHSVNQGWWYDAESWDVGKIKVRGNSASGTAFVDGEEMLMTLRFVKVEDQWLTDYRHTDPEIEEFIRDTARFEGKSVQDVLVAWEEEETGKPVKKNIWQPPKK